MSFILIRNSAIPLCLTKVTDEFTGLENINKYGRVLYSLKSQCLLERRLYITLKDCIHTSWGWLWLWLLWPCYLLLQSSRPSWLPSCCFKAFLLLAALLLPFKLNWGKRHLLRPNPSWVTSSNCLDCCFQIFFFAEIFFLWGGISIKSPLRIVTKIVGRDFSEILTLAAGGLLGGIHRNGGILALDFTDFWGGHSPRQVSLFTPILFVSTSLLHFLFFSTFPLLSLSQIVLSLFSS